jgi:hypothetical protein
LWTADNGEEATKVTPDEDKVESIIIEEFTEVIKNIKSMKSPGSDGIKTNSSKVHLKVSLLKS